MEWGEKLQIFQHSLSMFPFSNVLSQELLVFEIFGTSLCSQEHLSDTLGGHFNVIMSFEPAYTTISLQL